MEKSNLISKEKTTQQNRVWVRITAACNEKCLFCLDADAQNGKLIPDDIVRKQIRDGFDPIKENRIIISWWEASINPHFSEYVAYAKEIGYDRIQTVTNGLMFARREFCEKLVNAWLQEVTISTHGHHARLHDYLTATPWSFTKALRAILNFRKFFPQIIINIDIVVCKVNVDYLPDIVQFFMKLGIMEYDILQIIPFWRWFAEYKDQLFYKVEEKLVPLHKTWQLSKIPGMYMWTNRFPVEAFEGYEDLIQDPRKIKSETMGEAYQMFDTFIRSDGKVKPICYGDQCSVCFLNQYCHDFLNHSNKILDNWIIHDIWDMEWDLSNTRYIALRWEEFPSQVYEKYGKTSEEFIQKIQNIILKEDQKLLNVPRCIRDTNNEWEYEWNNDLRAEKSVDDYTKNYILNLYRKKSIRCKSCKYNDSCQGIHINFIRSYGFKLLQPVKI